MSEYTETLNRIAREEARSHASDIEAATDAAVTRLREETWFADFVDDLVRSAVKSAIHDARSRMSHEAKRPSVSYGESADAAVSSEARGKVYRPVKSNAPRILRAARRATVMNIATDGKVLGEMTGEELLPSAERDFSRGAGYYRVGLLKKRLAEIVPRRKKVKNAVDEDSAQSLWSEIESMDMTPAVAMEPTLSQAGN